MTTLEAIELFYNEMIGEITHTSADEELQETLLRSLKEVKKTVIATLNASK